MKDTKKLFALVFLLFLPAFAGEGQTGEKLYSVVLLNITDQAKYDAYRNQVTPLLAQVGGQLERDLQLMSPGNAPANLGPFNRALVVSYATPQGPEKFMAHPHYQESKPLLEAATNKLAVISSWAKSSPVAHAGDEAVFIIKLAWFKEQTDSGKMNAQIKAINQQLTPYGFHEERVLNHLTTKGLDSTPDKVTVMFVESKRAQQELQANEAVYGQIQTFNQTWLKDAVYLVGREIKAQPLESPRTDGIAIKVSNAPLRVVRTVKVNMDSDKLFGMLADHKNLPQVLNILHDVKVDNSQAKVADGLGCKRICTLADGNVITEEIVSWTPGSSYAYALSEANPLGLKNHVAIFHVEPTRSGQSTLTWSQYFDHPMADQATAQISGIMDMVLAQITAQPQQSAMN